ncbi:hypothetical protein AGDE_09321 [Angomonas deanei]|nr:hypothetical protein AGDE_09321 [Angomonas deanei]|eukprot:EPY30678.1 hypothetical protein AGDE_09321 [Angomonas deanei]
MTDIPFDIHQEKAELNQYWYSPHTINVLLNEIIKRGRKCAFLSTPSLYFAMLARLEDEKSKHIKNENLELLCKESKLFEFDPQWTNHPNNKNNNVIFYDYNDPERIPIQCMNAFDYVVADPPFITSEVWQQYMKTIHFILLKNTNPSVHDTQRVLGKVLLTTVMENHSCLECFYDGPLFIAPFRPSIPHLTYQYVCFTNYYIEFVKKEVKDDDDTEKEVSLWGGLEHINTKELKFEEEDRQWLLRITMANDLKLSEQSFTSEMVHRDRDGEEVLPSLRRPKNDDHETKDLTQVPIEKMSWGYIPEGLTLYKDGDQPPPHENNETENKNKEDAYGSEYQTIKALRETIDAFKGKIDVLQRCLDQQMKLRKERLEWKKKRDAETDPTVKEAHHTRVVALDGEVDAAQAARLRECDALRELYERILALEAPLGPNSNLLAYQGAMEECMQVYATVEAKKSALQELAADATRKYKSPLFHRMKELLQAMKDIKKGCEQQQPAQTE